MGGFKHDTTLTSFRRLQNKAQAFFIGCTIFIAGGIFCAAYTFADTHSVTLTSDTAGPAQEHAFGVSVDPTTGTTLEYVLLDSATCDAASYASGTGQSVSLTNGTATVSFTDENSNGKYLCFKATHNTTEVYQSATNSINVDISPPTILGMIEPITGLVLDGTVTPSPSDSGNDIFERRTNPDSPPSVGSADIRVGSLNANGEMTTADSENPITIGKIALHGPSIEIVGTRDVSGDYTPYINNNSGKSFYFVTSMGIAEVKFSTIPGGRDEGSNGVGTSWVRIYTGVDRLNNAVLMGIYDERIPFRFLIADSDQTIMADHSVSLMSSNFDSEYAKEGDTLTVTFVTSEDLQSTPAVTIAGQQAQVTGSGTMYTATTTVHRTTTEGPAAFNIGPLTDNLGNSADPDREISDVEIDRTDPRLSDPSDIGVTTDTTPEFTFTASEVGTMLYAGSCISNTMTSVSGSNTVMFQRFMSGTYDDCTIRISDGAGNISAVLKVPTFTVEGDNPVTISLKDDSDTGYSNTDGITGDKTPTVTITGFSEEASVTITATRGAGNDVSTTRVGDGDSTFGALAEGRWAVSASDGTDTTAALKVVIDSLPPYLIGIIRQSSEEKKRFTFSIDAEHNNYITNTEQETLTPMFSGDCEAFPSEPTWTSEMPYDRAIHTYSTTIAVPKGVYKRCSITLSDEAGNRSETRTFDEFSVKGSGGGGKLGIPFRPLPDLFTGPQAPVLPQVETRPTSETQSASETFTEDLSLGSEGEEVRRIQRFLNTNGFQISESGAGSPGQETDYFGPATQSALARYQAANSITPAQGYFGPVTRDHINSALRTTTTTQTTPATTDTAPAPEQTTPATTDTAPAPAQATTDTTQTIEGYTYTLGDISSVVREAQQLLNRTECPVAIAGAGSPGQETEYFGSLTKKAVMCYQALNSELAITGTITQSFIDHLTNNT